MLKYDKDDGYKVNLNEKQGRLIDAIANYGVYWAKQDGYPELAKNIGLSQKIENHIKKLEPKKHSRNDLSC